jgi:hypothetical protein
MPQMATLGQGGADFSFDNLLIFINLLCNLSLQRKIPFLLLFVRIG